MAPVAVGAGIAVDATGASHLTGGFGAIIGSSTLEFGSLPRLTSFGEFDMFVATLSAGPVATPNELAEAAFRVFPNPAAPTARLTVAGLLPDVPVCLTLFDALGRTVQAVTVAPAGTGTTAWAPAAVPAGLYTLRAEPAGTVRTRYVVIE